MTNLVEQVQSLEAATEAGYPMSGQAITEAINTLAKVAGFLLNNAGAKEVYVDTTATTGAV
jgi:hypothetical protein